MSVRSAVLVLLVATLIAGCGTASQHRESPQPQGISSAALKDPRTVDPCGFAAPTEFRKFGEVSNAGTVSLDYCLLHIQTGDGALIQVALGELGKVTSKQDFRGDPVLPLGKLQVVHNARIPGHCARQVLLSDHVTVGVRVTQLSGKQGTALCSVADIGARAISDTITANRVRHRQFPPNSLAFVDPCMVVDQSTVDGVAGLRDTRGQGSPSAHRCQWGKASAKANRVRLVHTAGEPPVVRHGTSVEEHIAGRRTVFNVIGGNPATPLCSAETPHVPFTSSESKQVEVAMIVVALPGKDGISACEVARGIAARTWPHLPKTG